MLPKVTPVRRSLTSRSVTSPKKKSRKLPGGTGIEPTGIEPTGVEASDRPAVSYACNSCRRVLLSLTPSVAQSGPKLARNVHQLVNPAGSAIEPTGIDPTGAPASSLLLTRIEPTGIDPTGMEPTGIEPTGIEPTGAVLRSMLPIGIEPTGIDPTGTPATSSAKSVVEFTFTPSAAQLKPSAASTPAGPHQSSGIEPMGAVPMAIEARLMLPTGVELRSTSASVIARPD